MKVLLVNGSPREKRCTYTVLSEIAAVLTEEGIESEIIWLGSQPISGCLDCGGCRRNGICSVPDGVNDFLQKAKEADGFVFGSPVHYGAVSGSISSFMHRAFFTDMHAKSEIFYLKPAASVVTLRRGGATTAFDQLNKYFMLSQMPVISSKYWNMVHGNTPEEIRQDLEGLQVMRVLGRNMAWFLKCKEAGMKAGLPLPKKEANVSTNFIR